MKKKLAIYADSHGDNDVTGSKLNKSIDLAPSWWEYLQSDYDITNYSQHGSSTYYSFNNFLETHTQYDKIIFIPSQFGRIEVTLDDGCVKYLVPGFAEYVVNQHIKYFKYTPLDLKKMKAALDYINYLLDMTKEDRINNCFIHEVARLRPDVLFIPAFESTIWPSDVFVLSRVHYEEIKLIGIDVSKKYWDLRKCHLTDENNEILYKKVKTALENNDRYAYFKQYEVIKPKKPHQYYFLKCSDEASGSFSY